MLGGRKGGDSGRTADLSSFLHPHSGRSEEVARHSAHISHVWTSLPPAAIVTLFCPALQTDSGFFLFPDQCQQARHDYRMQILPWPGFTGNSLGSCTNSTAPCLLKLEGCAHKCSAQTHPEQVSAGFCFSICESFWSDTRGAYFWKKNRLSKVLHFAEQFHNGFKQVLGPYCDREGLSPSLSHSD